MAITITDSNNKIIVADSDNGSKQVVIKGDTLKIWSTSEIVYMRNIGDDYKVSIPCNKTIYASSAALLTAILALDAAYSQSVSNLAVNISTSAVITAITTEANWSTGVFVDPGGILAQINSGQVYVDTTNKIMYQYNGTVLVRWSIDNIG
jgi:hypothetical protein